MCERMCDIDSCRDILINKIIAVLPMSASSNVLAINPIPGPSHAPDLPTAAVSMELDLQIPKPDINDLGFSGNGDKSNDNYPLYFDPDKGDSSKVSEVLETYDEYMDYDNNWCKRTISIEKCKPGHPDHPGIPAPVVPIPVDPVAQELDRPVLRTELESPESPDQDYLHRDPVYYTSSDSEGEENLEVMEQVEEVGSTTLDCMKCGAIGMYNLHEIYTCDVGTLSDSDE